MKNLNEQFYFVDDCFELHCNENIPNVEGVIGYVDERNGDLRFYLAEADPDNEKGCWVSSEGDNPVFGYYDAAAEVQGAHPIESTDEKYVSEVNRLVKEWFAK